MADQLKEDRAAIRKLQELAMQLLLDKVPYVERTMLLRAQTQEYGLSARDGELMLSLIHI